MFCKQVFIPIFFRFISTVSSFFVCSFDLLLLYLVVFSGKSLDLSALFFFFLSYCLCHVVVMFSFVSL